MLLLLFPLAVVVNISGTAKIGTPHCIMDLDEDQRSITNHEICQQLVNDAPTEEIRAILSLYDINKDKKDIYAVIKSHRRVDVQATAEYLGLNAAGYNPTLSKAIIMKIDSYLLSTCAVCYKLYCIPPGDETLFSCKRCGQGCHRDCYKNLTPLPGIKFFCSECDDDSVPSQTLPTETILTEVKDDDHKAEDDDDDDDDDDESVKSNSDDDDDDDDSEAGSSRGDNTLVEDTTPKSPAVTPASASFRIQHEILTQDDEDYIPCNQEAYLQL